MTHQELPLFFLQIAAMLSAALLCGQILRRLGLPTVVGELLGGVLLGPTLLGALAPGAYAWLFPSGGSTAVARDSIVKLGMLFFLFVAGLEIDLGYVQKRSRAILWTSTCGIVAPFALGLASVLLWPDEWGPQARSNTLLFALFMGTALSISALPVIARILMDLDLMKSDVGMLVMGAATIDDLVGWSLFALILSSFAAGGSGGYGVWANVALLLVLVMLIVCVGRWLGPRALRFLETRLTWPSNFIEVTAIVILIAAALTEIVGAQAVLGAFFVGVALARSGHVRSQAHEVVYQFVVSFFAPLYFVSIGLQTNFAANFDLRLVLWLFIIASVGKIAGAGIAAWMSKMEPRDGLAVGFGLNARGAMGIILASVSLEHNLIDQRLFVALVVMALGTSVLSGPIMQRLMRRSPASAEHPPVPGRAVH